MGDKTEAFEFDLVPIYIESALEAELYDFIVTHTEYLERMRKLGRRVVVPDQRELQIDLDNKEQAAQFKGRFLGFLKIYYDEAKITRKARSANGGWHITVRMPFDMSPAERIAWQLALGSDPVREILGLLRWRAGTKDCTFFTE